MESLLQSSNFLQINNQIQQSQSFLNDYIQQSATYISMLWYRRFTIFISCVALAINIFLIIKKKQYVFNTLKLFMWVEIFYFIALVVVLPHTPYLTNGGEFPSNKNIQQQTNQLIIQMQNQPWKIILCALQAFFNQVAYNISYFFAVLITLYVRKLLNNTHKNFMKQNKMLIIVVISFIVLFFAIPFSFSFLETIPYSFGPTGFYLPTYWFGGNDYKFSLYTCNLCSRESNYGFLAQIWMVAIPLAMFFIHLGFLLMNYITTRQLRELQQINPRQWFAIKTGMLSALLFSIQAINFMKFILTSLIDYSPYISWFIVLLNAIFDLFPLILTWIYYKKYYKKANTFRDSTRIQSDSSSLITNQQFIQRLRNEQNSRQLS